MQELRWQDIDEDTALERGEILADFVQAGQLIRLEGTLGAGKTTFTRGIARGLGIQRAIKSPSYTIIREYQQGRLPLYHIDLYRLEDGGVSDLALDEYFYGQGLCVLEWGSVSEEDLPSQCLQINFEISQHGLSRDMHIQAFGQEYEDLLELWADHID